MMLALLAGVIAWAAWGHEGAWWEKTLAGAGALVVWFVGGVLGCLLFAGGLWLFFASGRLRKRAALRRLLRHDASVDPAGAIALAEPLTGSFDSACDEILRRDPALCRRLAEAARRDGPVRRYFLLILMNHAPWSADVESALYDGRNALEPRDRWSWLYWFRRDMPKGNPAYGERLAAALEWYLSRASDHDRRRAWHDCLALAVESNSWRRLAGRHRGDLDALLADERVMLDADSRQGLARLEQLEPA